MLSSHIPIYDKLFHALMNLFHPLLSRFSQNTYDVMFSTLITLFLFSTLITFVVFLSMYFLHTYHVFSFIPLPYFSPHLSHVISSGFTTLFSPDLCHFFYIYEIISCTIMTLFPLSRQCYSLRINDVIFSTLIKLFPNLSSYLLYINQVISSTFLTLCGPH